MQVAPTPENLTAAKNAVAAFQTAESVPYVRRTPKGEKTLEVKQFLAGDVALAAEQDGIRLTFRLRMTSAGAVKPQEALRLLQDRFAFPVGNAACRRLSLWAETKEGLHDPFEI